MAGIKIERVWAMPNRNTFSIKPIKELISRYMDGGVWLDPFSRCSPFASLCVTNDLDPSVEADYHMEALDFLKTQGNNTADGVLFDPPYSPRQISECYKNVGRTVHAEDTQTSFYSKRKQEAARTLKLGGRAITFGWNTNGFGASIGFELVEVLVVAHGSAHNDTLCTVEIKMKENAWRA